MNTAYYMGNCVIRAVSAASATGPAELAHVCQELGRLFSRAPDMTVEQVHEYLKKLMREQEAALEERRKEGDSPTA